MTTEQKSKLPKWAQEHIEDLDQRAVIAERTLKEIRNNQTPSEFFVEGWDGKLERHYVKTHKISVEREGVHVDILLRLDNPGVDVSFWSTNRLCREIAMVPTGFNQVRIMTKEQMR